MVQSLKCKVVEKYKEVTFTDVWAGGYWSMARAADGRIFSFGLNSYGQLGVSSGKVEDENGMDVGGMDCPVL
jgi:alpha-tubulin suppressor-like RCC1 family protein